MKVIAVTGGIASGKSTVVQLLTELGGKGVEVFDCDAVARRLRDGGMLTEALVAVFGDGILEETGAVSAEKLRAVVTGDEEKRRSLEALVHPRLAEEFAAGGYTRPIYPAARRTMSVRRQGLFDAVCCLDYGGGLSFVIS